MKKSEKQCIKSSLALLVILRSFAGAQDDTQGCRKIHLEITRHHSDVILSPREGSKHPEHSEGAILSLLNILPLPHHLPPQIQ